MAKSRIYHVWQGMIQRCTNPKKDNYSSYGGRGITVCARWRTFTNFLADMGEPPTDKHQIDRKNNNGNYEPSNCRWATSAEQQNNKSNNRLITYSGRTQSVSIWARELGVKPEIIFGKLRRGWDVESIFTNVHARKKMGGYMPAHDKSPKVKRRVSFEQAKEIKNKFATGNFSQRELAQEYQINQSGISRIVCNKTYKGSENNERFI